MLLIRLSYDKITSDAEQSLRSLLIKVASDQDNFLRKNYLCFRVSDKLHSFRNSFLQNKDKHILILIKSHSGQQSIFRFFRMNLNLSSARGFVKISAH